MQTHFWTAPPACDVSFLANLKWLVVEGLHNCSVTLSTSVNNHQLESCKQVVVWGTASFTHLVVGNEGIRLTACSNLHPKLLLDPLKKVT